MNKPVQEIELPNGKRLPEHRLTEEEFVAWRDEDTRAEWVDGNVVMMAPANDEHVDLCGWLVSILRIYCEQHDLGVARGPEFEVRLGGQRRRRVPDVLFVSKARQDILRRTHVEGAPDLVIEIVSPDSEARDWRDKYLEYQVAGVREYWVIDPASEHLEAYALTTERGYTRIEEKDDAIGSTALPGFFIRTAWLWQDPLPKVLDVLRELGVPG